MTPLLFPYTFVSDYMKEKITGVFGSFVFLDSIIPADDNYDRRFEAAVAACHQFAADNLERAGSFMKGCTNVPLFDPDSSSNIYSEVWKSVADGNEEIIHDNSSDRFIKSRVLLEIAGDYDRRKQEIENGIESIRQREKILLDELQGETLNVDGLHTTVRINQNFSDETHINMRLEAWIEVLLYLCQKKNMPLDYFFFSTSYEAVETLKERVQELIPVYGVDFESANKEEIQSLIRELSECDSTDIKLKYNMAEIDKTLADIVFYMAPGLCPEEFFMRLSGGRIREKRKNFRAENTLICYFKSQTR